MIPKIIYQTHELDRDKLPDFIQKNSESWIVMNPGYEYVYMNAEERRSFVEDRCPELKNFYNHFNDYEPHLMFQADIWRYLIMYEFGGIYADMDSICISSFDNILEECKSYELIVHVPTDQDINVDWKTSNRKTNLDKNYFAKLINNANFAAIKKSITLKNLIDEVIKYNNNSLNPENWYGISPYTFSHQVFATANKNPEKISYKIQDITLHDGSSETSLERYKKQSKMLDDGLIVNYLGVKMPYTEIIKK